MVSAGMVSARLVSARMVSARLVSARLVSAGMALVRVGGIRGDGGDGEGTQCRRCGHVEAVDLGRTGARQVADAGQARVGKGGGEQSGERRHDHFRGEDTTITPRPTGRGVARHDTISPGRRSTAVQPFAGRRTLTPSRRMWSAAEV
ncbi:hypothetical protein Jiend_19710 [Micromonospora endophytica]|nr:hypothetical protein Jiend_19710 [Micromonospora endophytica]